MIEKPQVVQKWCTLTNALIAKYKNQTDNSTSQELTNTYSELCSLEDILVRLNYLSKQDLAGSNIAYSLASKAEK